MTEIRRRRVIAAAAAVPLASAWASAWAGSGPTVLAAASLTDVFKQLGQAWAAQGHAAPEFAFAASSTLARQIEQGAPADIFASADAKWADYLEQRGLLQDGSRTAPIGNALVLIAPATSSGTVALTQAGLSARLGADGRLAVGDPAGVPAGIYAQQALTRLRLWGSMQPQLAKADSVRSALLLVGRGEAPLGIVYATDAAIEPSVRVVATFPPETHDPIVYPFALLKRSRSAEARALLAYLSGPEAQPVYRRFGFVVE